MQSYTVYTIKPYTKGSEKREVWTKLGAAFAHKDGEGFDLVLTALPLDGRLVLRLPKSKEAREAAKAAYEAIEDEAPKAWVDGQRL